jgi:peptidoglycan/LPS O-acetylase OafA/YrhL
MQRIFFIDFIKAVAIFFLILIHCFSFYLGNNVILKIWNFSHFVVVAFVFASGFVLFDRYRKGFKNFNHIFHWYFKRIKRLLLPYYIYFLSHCFLYVLFPSLFKQYFKNEKYFFIKSLTLVGGLNHNWFVFLFIQLSFLFPFLIFLKNQKKFFYYLFFSFCVLFGILSINFFKFKNESYRFFMIFGWLIVYFISFELVDFYRKKSEEILMKAFFLFSLSLALFLYFFDKDLFLNSNYLLVKIKYPPTIFFIFYGLVVSFLLPLISGWQIFKLLFLKKIINFLANYSYNLYFIHFLILDFLANFKNSINPLLLFVFVLLTSSMFVYILNYLKIKKYFLLSFKKNL